LVFDVVVWFVVSEFVAVAVPEFDGMVFAFFDETVGVVVLVLGDPVEVCKDICVCFWNSGVSSWGVDVMGVCRDLTI